MNKIRHDFKSGAFSPMKSLPLRIKNLMEEAYFDKSADTGDVRIMTPTLCRAGMAALKNKHAPLYNWAYKAAKAALYDVRRYGKGRFYAWPYWEQESNFSFLNSFVLDPWPAARYPVDSLAYVVLLEMLYKPSDSGSLNRASGDEKKGALQAIHDLFCTLEKQNTKAP